VQIIDKVRPESIWCGSGFDYNDISVKKWVKNPLKLFDDVKAAVFEEVEGQVESEKSSATSEDELNLDVILDVPVTLSMEIGRTQINIRNLLQLNQGSYVELDRFAGEPLYSGERHTDSSWWSSRDQW